MKLLTTIAMTLAMVAVFSASSIVDAQQYGNGYQFGAGLNYGHFNGRNSSQFNSGFYGLGQIGLAPRVAEAPFFATNPPVYYSHIVPRPYGISPYAAPPGIMPIEMQVPVVPKKVVNPFFGIEVSPASIEPIESDVKPEETNTNKVTWIPNPYLLRMVVRK